MSKNKSTGAFAIVPTNDLPATIAFWERLGFERAGGDHHYIILTGWDCEVRVTQAGEGPWRVRVDHNPFGVFIRTPHVDAIAARVDDLIIRPGGILRHRDWGMYEFAVAAPDGLPVRIGWPSSLVGVGTRIQVDSSAFSAINLNIGLEADNGNVDDPEFRR